MESKEKAKTILGEHRVALMSYADVSSTVSAFDTMQIICAPYHLKIWQESAVSELSIRELGKISLEQITLVSVYPCTPCLILERKQYKCKCKMATGESVLVT
jgi:hypothetical protein